MLRRNFRQHAAIDFAARQNIFDFLAFRQTLDLHPFRRLPARYLLLLIRSQLERTRRDTVFILKEPAHPERYRIEMGAHANDLSGKVFGLLNAARLMHKDIAVAKFSMWENRDGGKRRAAIHPAEEYTQLELADVKFKIAGKPPVPLFGREREDVQIDPFRFDGAVNQKTGAVVFVARKRQAEICHIMTLLCVLWILCG